ncbi:hypothetical protein BTV20_04245 [Histophilus somni]|uniref:hypothetical protein n=1 Tax=Histophilus somni TaxID=731 RepID=UPI000165F992|nr:hypothetical protein [Histophilus somni]ACA31342.1 conserved hypothetical protein [Histophilus somni 2336]ARU64682.1 hypothetical protein BTV18_03815 [Histophilus somni]ARU66547.1 hypothetical protein BTV19_04240 [Histophilus somni]ARU68421.1 hypothetical protein BTV16_04240 [Histophilus somni]ARU70300.1 hypothetical protein BTV20_04245 [Histophilus somni]
MSKKYDSLPYLYPLNMCFFSLALLIIRGLIQMDNKSAKILNPLFFPDLLCLSAVVFSRIFS